MKRPELTPGGLAIIARSVTDPAAIGKIVTTLKYLPAHPFTSIGTKTVVKPGWTIEPRYLNNIGKMQGIQAVSNLEPIGDFQGDDPTLTWAGHPEELTV